MLRNFFNSKIAITIIVILLILLDICNSNDRYQINFHNTIQIAVQKATAAGEDESFCDKIKDPNAIDYSVEDTRSECFTKYAVYKKDINICYKAKYTGQCFYAFHTAEDK